VGFSPTVRASEIALVDDWRHLHAIMAFNTVEFSLVALSVAKQRFFGPVARFHTAMFTNDMVPLFL
jgi:hypothetical protein